MNTIGIGTPIAERPSHTTGHTGHVSGDSAVRKLFEQVSEAIDCTACGNC